MQEVHCFTNIAPLYRSCLWAKLLSSHNFTFHIHFGKKRDSGIKEIDFHSERFKQSKDKIHEIRNYYIFNKYLIWQSGVIGICVQRRMVAAIFLGDFLVLSTWLGALICKARGIKTAFWSHGIYGNEKGLKKMLRVVFYKLADRHLLYERRGKKMMVKNGFQQEKIHVVFNSLDYEKMLALRDNHKVNELDLSKFFENPKLPYVIFTGRLTKVKKLDLLFAALNTLLSKGRAINLLLVGDGSEKNKLVEYAENNKISTYVHFYGPCYSEEELSILISNAEICVSPGNVGLTAIHSLSYGTPVCTHDNAYNQMPEMEAIEEGVTGIFFEEDNVKALTKAIEKWVFSNERNRATIRQECYKIVDTYYNPTYQLKVFENLLSGGQPMV